jgi:hypothetical protein
MPHRDLGNNNSGLHCQLVYDNLDFGGQKIKCVLLPCKDLQDLGRLNPNIEGFTTRLKRISFLMIPEQNIFS